MKGKTTGIILFLLLVIGVSYCQNNIRDVEADDQSTFFSVESQYYPSIPSIQLSSIIIGIQNSDTFNYIYLSFGLSLLGEGPVFGLPAKSEYNTNLFHDNSYYGGSVAVLTQGYTIIDGQLALSSSSSTLALFSFSSLFSFLLFIILQ